MANILKKKQLWGGLIALAILVYLFYDLNITRTLDLCRVLDLRFLVPALFCTTMLVVFKAWRWKVIVSRTRKIFFWPTLFLYATSQLIGVLLPALTGQAGRIILFSRKGNFSKTYAFSTVFLEVVFDAAGLLFLMLLSSSVFVFPHQYRFISYIIGIATFLLLVLFYASLHYQKKLEDYGYRRIRPRSPKTFLVIRKFLRSFNEGISVMRHTDKMFALSFLTICSWASYIAAIYSLFFLFRFNLPVLAAVVVIIVNYLALMIPITPGNVGSFQLAVVASLNIFSIHKTEAVLFSVILYLVDMIPMIVLSAFFLFHEHFAISDISGDKELIAEVEKMVVEQDLPAEKELP